MLVLVGQIVYAVPNMNPKDTSVKPRIFLPRQKVLLLTTSGDTIKRWSASSHKNITECLKSRKKRTIMTDEQIDQLAQQYANDYNYEDFNLYSASELMKMGVKL